MTSLVSIFQPLIVEKIPKGFSVIANINGEKAAAAFDKFRSMHQNGQINPILSDMIGSIQGALKFFRIFIIYAVTQYRMQQNDLMTKSHSSTF